MTLTYHLMIKFPTEYGVGEVCGDQVAACDYYIVMLEMDDHLQTMSIEEQQTVAKPIKGLEEILLNNSRPKQTTRISTLASPPIRQALTTFLKENQDVFAWNHEDMPRIDLSVMMHKLNVSPIFPHVRQKKQVFAQELHRAIAEEVRKLQDVDFTREVYYPD